MQENDSKRRQTKEYDRMGDQGFDFECFQRDQLVEKDKKKIQGFLSEQKKDQELDRAYA